MKDCNAQIGFVHINLPHTQLKSSMLGPIIFYITCFLRQR